MLPVVQVVHESGHVLPEEDSIHAHRAACQRIALGLCVLLNQTEDLVLCLSQGHLAVKDCLKGKKRANHEKY